MAMSEGRPRREVRPRFCLTEDELYEDEDDAPPSSRLAPRKTGKESLLDPLAGNGIEVPGAPELNYSLGGVETGGKECERILREVEIDDDAINLKGQFQNGRRVLLSRGSRGLAAAVVEMKVPVTGQEKVFEIPILASARTHRQQGHGSVLVALLFELAARLGATMIVVSATNESRRFWLKQGLHTLAHADPAVGAAMRALAQRGVRYGFFQTTPMAVKLPEAAHQAGALVAAALERVRSRLPAAKGLPTDKVAQIVGYEDLQPGASFRLDGDGRRVLLQYTAAEERPLGQPCPRTG